MVRQCSHPVKFAKASAKHIKQHNLRHDKNAVHIVSAHLGHELNKSEAPGDDNDFDD